jgi:hypothetical protein
MAVSGSAAPWSFANIPAVFARATAKKKQGAGKKQTVTPVVGGWVRVRKRTRVRFIFLLLFYRVFELPSSRNAQKRDKTNFEKK